VVIVAAPNYLAVHGVPRQRRDGANALVAHDVLGSLGRPSRRWSCAASAVPHGFRNAADAPARMFVVLTPGVQGLEMFRHFDRAGRAARLQPEDIVGIAAQYGVRFVQASP
jgi:hypothetical protein